MPFMFEDLELYKKAMKFITEIFIVDPGIKNRTIRDQLRRASISIPLNIAEGQGRMHGRGKRQFYNTARGSLLECVPLVELCHRIGYINGEKYQYLYSIMEEMGKMLSGLIKSVKLGERK